MAEDCRMIVDKLRFGSHEILYDKSKKITFRNAVGAVWTIEVFFYRPFGLRINFPFQLRFRRAWVKLSCENLKRRVFVDGKIQIKSRHSSDINAEGVIQSFFEKGYGSFELDTTFENIYDKIPSIYVTGELKVYVNPENYFFYRYGLGFLPAESQLQATRLQAINELSEDFLSAMSQENTFDVVLRCESEEYKAHKVVLSARSKVFSAMFQHPMEENKNNVVNIKDMSSAILRVLLEFIYSGKVTTLTNCENAFELVSAADLYDLPRLKKITLFYLQSILSPTNALDILTFAELYDKNLKKKSLDYICAEFDYIKKTQEWCLLQTKQPQLANEVLLNIIEFVNSDRK